MRTPLPLLAVLFAAAAGCSALDPEPERITVPGTLGYMTATPATGTAASVDVDPRASYARIVINGLTVFGNRYYSGEEDFEGPVPLRAGIPFDVTVTTLGGDSTRPEPSEVEVAGREATVSVFDSELVCHYDDPYECVEPAVQVYLPRTARLVFEEAGEGEVVIRGRLVTWGVEYRPHELRFPVIVTE